MSTQAYLNEDLFIPDPAYRIPVLGQVILKVIPSRGGHALTDNSICSSYLWFSHQHGCTCTPCEACCDGELFS